MNREPFATVHQPSILQSTALLDSRFWVEQALWRIAGGWSMAAALLALGVPLRAGSAPLPELMLLFLLVDPLWGSIWGAMTAPDRLPALAHSLRQARIWLPYLHAGSPAARLLGKESPGILPLLGRVIVPGIVLTLLVSTALDPTLFWLSLLVVGVSSGGWLHRQVELVPVMVLHTLVSVTLPWLATLLTIGGVDPIHWPLHTALMALWSLHTWGAHRNLGPIQDRFGLIAMAGAQAGIVVLLVWARTPLWLAVLGVLWLPTWLAVSRQQPLQRVQIWWLAALLISSMALGQGSFLSV